jgi:hypothetical protein
LEEEKPLESPERYNILYSVIIGTELSLGVWERIKHQYCLYLVLPSSYITLSHVISRTPSEEFSRLLNNEKEIRFRVRSNFMAATITQELTYNYNIILYSYDCRSVARHKELTI